MADVALDEIGARERPIESAWVDVSIATLSYSSSASAGNELQDPFWLPMRGQHPLALRDVWSCAPVRADTSIGWLLLYLTAATARRGAARASTLRWILDRCFPPRRLASHCSQLGRLLPEHRPFPAQIAVHGITRVQELRCLLHFSLIREATEAVRCGCTSRQLVRSVAQAVRRATPRRRWPPSLAAGAAVLTFGSSRRLASDGHCGVRRWLLLLCRSGSSPSTTRGPALVMPSRSASGRSSA